MPSKLLTRIIYRYTISVNAIEEVFKMKRIIILLMTSLLMTSCATAKQPVTQAEKKQEFLYVYPDGKMEFRGRIMNEEDVIIYEDGRGGERAAVKLFIPRRSHVFRDSIIVERNVIDVLVEQKR